MGGTPGVANVAEQEHVVAQKWGAVSGLAWPPECWLTGTGATPATIDQWTMHTRDTADDLEAGRILAVRLYRSVRRQIFRKFVRPHRRYLSILTSAKRADLYGLDREQAYAPSWQRVPIPVGSSCNMFDGAKLYFPGARNRSIRHWKLRMPTLDGLAPSIELVPHVLYAEFLRIWMELEVGHVGSNLKVVVNPLRGGNLSLPVRKSLLRLSRGSQLRCPVGRSWCLTVWNSRVRPWSGVHNGNRIVGLCLMGDRSLIAIY